MDDQDWLAQRFEEHRAHLRAVAYRMLGSLPEADEAVQDAWLRLSRSGAEGVENLGGWLTTIVARVCLNALQARKARPEQPAGLRMPDPVVSREGDANPEQKRCSPIRSGSPSSSCSTLWVPPSAWPSCSTTCSTCPSRRSRRWSVVRHGSEATRQPGTSKGAGRGRATCDADRARQREVVDAFFAAAEPGTSPLWFGCLIRTSCCVPMSKDGRRCAVQRMWLGWHAPAHGGPRRCFRCSSTELREPSSSRMGERSRCDGLHRFRRQDRRDRRNHGSRASQPARARPGVARESSDVAHAALNPQARDLERPAKSATRVARDIGAARDPRERTRAG
jgi:hypothetical protein